MNKNFWLKITKTKNRPDNRFHALNLIINNRIVDKEFLIFTTWSLSDYKKQWIDGLERIKYYHSSCLITAFIQNNKLGFPYVQTYDLHKTNNQLFIQPRIFFSDEYINMLKLKAYNSKTCYDFIKPIITHTEKGYETVYWTCEYNENEIDQLIQELKTNL